MNPILRLKYFLNYQWRAKTKYYLHSPLVYQFYLNVLEGHEDAPLKSIGALRKQLHNNKTAINITDLGTGNLTTKTICDIESNVAVRPKYGRLLYRLVKYFQTANIVELGTAIGLSSAYMALANPQAAIISLEGSASLINIAKTNHAALGIQNVAIYQGNFNDILPSVLKQHSHLGLVFFDGNHRKQATLQYFNLCLEKATPDSIFIFDDIHWSEEMNAAWAEIKAHPQITLSLDVFQFGICFFKKEKLAKEEFILRY
jgi:predicted O-methyltransferase YrrM